MKRTVLVILSGLILVSGCRSYHSMSNGGKEYSLVVHDDASPDNPKVEIFEGRDAVQWKAGPNVGSMTIKFTDPGAPALDCDRTTVCTLHETATPGKGRCKDSGGNPVGRCEYNYEIMVWKKSGGTAGKDPVVIIKQYP